MPPTPPQLDPPRTSLPASDRHLWQFRWVCDLAYLSVAFLVLWIAYRASSITVPILIGLSMAYIFNPFISWARRRWYIPRWVTAAAIITVFASGLVLFVVLAVPPLYDQITKLARNIPGYVENTAKRAGIQLDTSQLLEQWLARFPAHDEPVLAPAPDATPSESPPSTPAPAPNEVSETNDAAPTVAESPTSPALQTAAETTPESTPTTEAPEAPIEIPKISAYAGPVAEVLQYLAAAVIAFLLYLLALVTYLPIALVIIGFCFFVFSSRWAPFTRWFEQFIPLSQRQRTLEIVGQMDRSVAAFIRGRLIQSAVMSVLLSIGWFFTGVPYWLLLALMCGLFNMVPYLAAVGWLTALALASLDSMSGGGTGFSWQIIVWPSVVYGIAQFLDGWVVEPLVQGKATNLDPLSVLLAVLIGASLAGVLGMLLAIPTAACIKILAREVIIPNLRNAAERQ